MSPSRAHEGLASASASVVGARADIIGLETVMMRGTRWKRYRRNPDGTVMGVDAVIDVGSSAQACRPMRRQGMAAAEEFESTSPPDLMAEIELPHLNREKSGRIAEMWQATRGDDGAVPVTILDLRSATGPDRDADSGLLAGLSEARAWRGRSRSPERSHALNCRIISNPFCVTGLFARAGKRRG